MNEDFLLMSEEKKKKKVVSWDETAPGKDAVMIVEMTRNNLEYYINLVDKAMAGVEWMTPSLKYILVWVKCYQIALKLQRSPSWKEKVITVANFIAVLF